MCTLYKGRRCYIVLELFLLINFEWGVAAWIWFRQVVFLTEYLYLESNLWLDSRMLPSHVIEILAYQSTCVQLCVVGCNKKLIDWLFVCVILTGPSAYSKAFKSSDKNEQQHLCGAGQEQTGNCKTILRGGVSHATAHIHLNFTSMNCSVSMLHGTLLVHIVLASPVLTYLFSGH